MHRYRLVVFYADKATETRIAQIVIVIAESDQAAVQAAKAEVAKDAVGGRVHSIKLAEKLPITSGVVFRGEPYIPMTWPDPHPAPEPKPLAGKSKVESPKSKV